MACVVHGCPPDASCLIAKASPPPAPERCCHPTCPCLVPPLHRCAPCRRSFTTPDGLLSHLKAAHKQDSERIAALEALRWAGLGATDGLGVGWMGWGTRLLAPSGWLMAYAPLLAA